MIKNLTSIGNSLGLIIDKPILELLRIDKDTPLEVVTDGTGLIIRPVHEQESDAPLKTPDVSAPKPEPVKAEDQSPAKSAKNKVQPPALPDVPDEEDEPRNDSENNQPRIIIELKGKSIKELPLDKDEMIFGRDKKCDIHLDDRGLSRRHAMLESRGGAIWISDLGSSNGTYVNGEPITSSICLHSGDTIAIGLYRVRLEGLDEIQTGTPILTLQGPEGVHRFALTGEQITIGRGQKNDISIPHKSISRKHIMIRITDGQFIVEDLGSQNGIKIKGKRIEGPTEIQPGTVLEVCEFEFELSLVEDEPEPESPDRSMRKRPATMLINKSVVVNAAYVGGDFERAESKGGMLALQGTEQAGAKQDTGEFKVPKAVKKKRQRKG